MNAIKKTKKMMADGLAVITNPQYLVSDLADKRSVKIKKMRQDNGQLTGPAQHEMSLRGDRLALVEFHRFMFGLSDSDIKYLSSAMKHFVYDEKLVEDSSVYADQRLLQDAIHYQLSLRFDEQGSPSICEEIANDFKSNVKLAINFPEITSDHLIQFSKNLFKKYTVPAKNFMAARLLLGLSQAKLAEKLGWSSVRQITNIETGTRTIKKQTQLAIECLLRRAKQLNAYKKLIQI